MKSISLILMTEKGDEVGRLHLPEVQVAAAGEVGIAPVRPQLLEQMEEVYAHIHCTLTAEGLEVALEPLDMQIAVSRALLGPDDEESVLISLPIRELSPDGVDSTDQSDKPAPTPEDPDWADLFDLDNPKGEKA